MKDPPNMRKLRRETERVVRNVLKEVGKYDHIGKKEFESILDKIILQIHRNRRIDIEQIASKTGAVVQAFPKEYGQLDESIRGWEAIITYLYLKYQVELGLLSEAYLRS